MAAIPIDDERLKAIQDYAERGGKTVEQVVAEAVDRLLDEAQSELPYPKDGGTLGHSLLALAGKWRSGYTDTSERTHEVLREHTDPVRGWTLNRDSDH